MALKAPDRFDFNRYYVVQQDGALGKTNFFRLAYENFKSFLGFTSEISTDKQIIAKRFMETFGSAACNKWLSQEQIEPIRAIAVFCGIAPQTVPIQGKTRTKEEFRQENIQKFLEFLQPGKANPRNLSEMIRAYEESNS